MPQPALESNTVFLRQSNIKANTSIAYLYFMVKIVGKQLANSLVSIAYTLLTMLNLISSKLL